MYRLRLGGLERLEALDELAPERLERRVPVKAREAAHLDVQLNDRKAAPVCLHT